MATRSLVPQDDTRLRRRWETVACTVAGCRGLSRRGTMSNQIVANTVEYYVNVLEGLQTIRQRLVDNEATPETLALVDTIMKRAALPAAAAASTQSLLQLVRMLARSPVSSNNMAVYNDLLRLEEELQTSAAQYHERMQAEESKPIPKTKKYYKELKERKRA